MADRTSWREVRKPRSEAAQWAYEDEASISEFRELVYRLRSEASLTQGALARRMGTTQSAIARIEAGGTRPTLDTLGRLAAAVGHELVVAVGENLSENRVIHDMVRNGHAVVRRASPPGREPGLEEGGVLDLAGQVRPPTIVGLPSGYRYGVTRYADVVLQEAFRDRFDDLQAALEEFRPMLDELRAGGGGRTVFVRRFDESLSNKTEEGQDGDGRTDERVWGKQNITIEKAIGFDGETEPVLKVRGHEIDMFGKGSPERPFPGVAVEMEWNNKDPFFDRDLINFQALHHEGAIAVGVIVTRGPELQNLISGVIRSKDGGFKYGSSTTHWDKLVPRVNLGGGGECPLLLIGIEPDRIFGAELAHLVRSKLDEAEALKKSWRDTYSQWSDAKPEYDALRSDAFDLMPPLAEE